MHRADLIDAALALGFDHAEWIDNQQIVCNRVFRELCEANACGLYGKCWMCPPDAGDIDELIQRVRSYSNGFVYQSIFKIEDSFDFEGMQEAGDIHVQRSHRLDETLRKNGVDGFLHLSKGGCGICPICSKRENKPCRFPDKAISSLEAYGINVSATVKSTSMKYINGVNTVTYFGMILFKENNDVCRD